MNNSIKQFKDLNNQLNYLNQAINQFDYLEFENRQNQAIIKNYSKINIKKIWINGYVTINQLSTMINDLQLEIKNFKLKQFIKLSNQPKQLINDYFKK